MIGKRRDAYVESLEVLARCRKYARQAQIDTAVLVSAVPPGAIGPTQSVVIRGKRIELDRKSINVLLDWQALGGSEREAFARAIAAKAKVARSAAAE
jgi:hypothetical protein